MLNVTYNFTDALLVVMRFCAPKFARRQVPWLMRFEGVSSTSGWRPPLQRIAVICVCIVNLLMSAHAYMYALQSTYK